jgi:hypothetical protein
MFSILLGISVTTFSLFAQDMDCASTIKYRYADSPYVFDNQSKSAICYSGQKYDYEISLFEGNEYRFSFYASTIFNNNIHFKIVNPPTGEVILNLPGEAVGNNTSAILDDYFDPMQKKFIHPYFDYIPDKNLNLKVIVEVGEQVAKQSLTSSVVIVDPNQKRGCVTVFLQSKKAEDYGF